MKTAHRQYGMSLIELMIAMTLGLVLMAGLVQIVVSTKQGFRIQESSGRMQENARFALDLLSREIRIADFWGGVESGDINTAGALTLTGTASCDNAWLSSTGFAVRGYEHAASPPLNCIHANDYVANTDVIALRALEPDWYAGDADTLRNTWPYMQVQIGRQGQFFMATASGVQGRPWTMELGTLTFGYKVSLLFLRPCSTAAGANCAATDDSGNPIPTLVSWTNNANAMAQSPLVNGIEQLQFGYGVDTDDDRVVNRWRTATDLGTSQANWAQVIAVRVGLVARGDALDEFTDTATYQMPGGYNYDPPTAVERYQRRLFIRDVQIRNRIRS